MTKLHPNQTGIEKRKYRRVLVVRPIKGHVKPVKSNKKEEDFSVHLMNISLSGAQIYSNQNLEISDQVQLELPSLETNPAIIYIGRVVWIHKNPMKSMGRYAYGVHFEGLTTEKIRFLEQNFYLGDGHPDQSF